MSNRSMTREEWLPIHRANRRRRQSWMCPDPRTPSHNPDGPPGTYLLNRAGEERRAGNTTRARRCASHARLQRLGDW